MNGATWLALGLALLMLPGVDRQRARTLAGRGRLATARPGGRLAPVPWRHLLGWCCAVVAVSALLLLGPVLGLAVAVLAATAARLAVIAASDRLERRQAIELLAAVRLLAADLDAGTRPDAAFAAAAAVCPAYRAELAAAGSACAGGHDPPPSATALGPLLQAWSVAAAVGAPFAQVVGHVADDLAARADQRRALAAALAGARSSAALLAGLPVLGLLLGSAMGAHPVQVLVSTDAGRVMCLVGVVLDAAGIFWTLRMTARGARMTVTWLFLGVGLLLAGGSTGRRERGPRAPIPLRGLQVAAGLAAAGVSIAAFGTGRGLFAGAVAVPLVVVLITRLHSRPAPATPDPALALALDLVAMVLRAGRPLSDALAQAGPVAGGSRGAQLCRVAGLLRLGADAKDAWRVVSADAVLAPVAGAAVRSSHSGVRLAAVFAELAVDVRAAARTAALTRAERVGVFAAAPLGLCFLPSFVCLGIVPIIIGIAGGVFRSAT